MKRTILFVLAFCLAGTLFAQAQPCDSFEKKTYAFAVKDGQTLSMDVYTPVIRAEKTPCVLFVFGGAFARGARDVEKYIPYFDYLVSNGFAVVSIDYRLGLKGVEQELDMSQAQFVARFVRTVDMAVEDLFDATNHILKHAEHWNIDPSMIVLNGSSAGAVTVLQGEYALVNRTMSSSRLPADFRYAGVISFAGAVFLTEGDISWDRKPCPVMICHGDADLQVPYHALQYEGAGLYGAHYLAETLAAKDYPYYFLKFTDYGHEIASNPMQDNREDVLFFLNHFVKEGKQYQIESEQKLIGKPQAKKDFTFQDYVMGNFGGR